MIRCWSAHAAEQVAMLRRADDARVASVAELRATFQGYVQRKRHARDADATYSGRGGDTLWELVRLRLRDIVGTQWYKRKCISHFFFGKKNPGFTLSAADREKTRRANASMWRRSLEHSAMTLQTLVVSTAEQHTSGHFAIRQRREMSRRVVRESEAVIARGNGKTLTGVLLRTNDESMDPADYLMRDVKFGLDDVCLPREHQDDITALCLLSSPESGASGSGHSGSSGSNLRASRTERAQAAVAAALAAASGIALSANESVASAPLRRHYLASGGGVEGAFFLV